MWEGVGLSANRSWFFRIRKHEDCAKLEMNGMIGVC